MGNYRGPVQPGGHPAAGDGQMAGLHPAAVRAQGLCPETSPHSCAGCPELPAPPRSRFSLAFPLVTTLALAFPPEPTRPSNVPQLRDLEWSSWDSLQARPHSTKEPFPNLHAARRCRTPAGATVWQVAPPPLPVSATGCGAWRQGPGCGRTSLWQPRKSIVGSTFFPGSLILQTLPNWNNLGPRTLHTSSLLMNSPGLHRCRTPGGDGGRAHPLSRALRIRVGKALDRSPVWGVVRAPASLESATCWDLGAKG